jgi:hypothetical protein
MSGFTLVIIVMLIMFAAVAIVMTQDDVPETVDTFDDDQPVLVESDEATALASPEIAALDQRFTESDTLHIDVLDTSFVEPPELESQLHAETGPNADEHPVKGG